MTLTITPEAAGSFTLHDRRKLKRINRRNLRTQRKVTAAHARHSRDTLSKASALAAQQLGVSRDPRCERRPTAADTARRSFLASTMRSHRHSGRREARPGHPASTTSGCGAGHKGGGDGSAGGDPPDGDEPSEDAGDDPSDGEIGWLAGLVERLFPDNLRASQFEAAVGTFLLDLDAEAGHEARARIYAELPDRLRLPMLNDVVTLAAALRGLHPNGCRCCGGHVEPMIVVDDDGICQDCWGFPVLVRTTSGAS